MKNEDTILRELEQLSVADIEASLFAKWNGSPILLREMCLDSAAKSRIMRSSFERVLNERAFSSVASRGRSKHRSFVVAWDMADLLPLAQRMRFGPQRPEKLTALVLLCTGAADLFITQSGGFYNLLHMFLTSAVSVPLWEINGTYFAPPKWRSPIAGRAYAQLSKSLRGMNRETLAQAYVSSVMRYILNPNSTTFEQALETRALAEL